VVILITHYPGITTGWADRSTTSSTRNRAQESSEALYVLDTSHHCGFCLLDCFMKRDSLSCNGTSGLPHVISTADFQREGYPSTSGS
jgi:hypothetical protein